MNKVKINQIIESTVKSIFGTVPFAGQALNEAFFDYRSRIKQERINNFTEMFVAYINKAQAEIIPIDTLKSENFGDLFEAILRRVAQTNSSEKLEYFRVILVNSISSNTVNEYNGIFLDIVDRINETQIKILKAHSLLTNNIRNLLSQKNHFEQELSRLSEKIRDEGSALGVNVSSQYYDNTKESFWLADKIKSIETEINLDKDTRKGEYYNIDESEFKFLVQDLFSKGLLIDDGVGMYDSQPFETMSITEFGRLFLKFITEYGDQQSEVAEDNNL